MKSFIILGFLSREEKLLKPFQIKLLSHGWGVR